MTRARPPSAPPKVAVYDRQELFDWIAARHDLAQPKKVEFAEKISDLIRHYEDRRETAFGTDLKIPLSRIKAHLRKAQNLIEAGATELEQISAAALRPVGPRRTNALSSGNIRDLVFDAECMSRSINRLYSQLRSATCQLRPIASKAVELEALLPDDVVGPSKSSHLNWLLARAFHVYADIFGEIPDPDDRQPPRVIQFFAHIVRVADLGYPAAPSQVRPLVRRLADFMMDRSHAAADDDGIFPKKIADPDEEFGSLEGELDGMWEDDVICPLRSGPFVNLDWTLRETEHGQEAWA